MFDLKSIALGNPDRRNDKKAKTTSTRGSLKSQFYPVTPGYRLLRIGREMWQEETTPIKGKKRKRIFMFHK